MRKELAIVGFVLLVLGRPLAHAQSDDLNGIAQVAFRVADLEKSRQFYASLGFETAFELSDAG
jgi:catechol-2,3-dioxygenase